MFSVATSASNNPDHIYWYSPTPEHFYKAKKENKLIILYLTEENCELCDMLEINTFSDPDVANKINKDFMPLLTSPELVEEIREKFGDGVFPTMIFVTPSGSHMLTISGYISAIELQRILELLTISNSIDRPVYLI